MRNPADTPSPIERAVRSARRRASANRSLELATDFTLAAAALAATAAATRFLAGFPPVVLPLLLLPAAAPAAALALALLRTPTCRAFAASLDRHARTADRFVTGLALEYDPPRGALAPLALQQCREFAAAFDPKRHIPIRIPRRLAAGAAPLTAIALLAAAHQFRSSSAAGRSSPLDHATAQALASQLDRLAANLRAPDPRDATPPPPELRDLADLLAATASHIRSEPDTLSALARISRAEDAAAAHPQAAGETADQLDRIAQSLEASPHETADPAAIAEQARRAGLSDEARRTVEELLRATRSPSPPSDPRASSLSNRSAAAALRNGATRLRESAANRARRFAAALDAIRAIKTGQTRPAQSPANQTAGSDLLTPADQPAPDDAAASRIPANSPSGEAPGSELDPGTTETVFGGNTPEPQPVRDSIAPSSDADGPARITLIPSAGDRSKPAVPRRDTLDSAAAAAEQSLEQENIPLGRRPLVRRYFDQLRESTSPP